MIPAPAQMPPDQSWVKVEDHGDWLRWRYVKEAPPCRLPILIAIAVPMSFLVSSQLSGPFPLYKALDNSDIALAIGVLIPFAYYLGWIMRMSHRSASADERLTKIERCLADLEQSDPEIQNATREDLLSLALEFAIIPLFARDHEKTGRDAFHGPALIGLLRDLRIQHPSVLVYGHRIEPPDAKDVPFAEPETVRGALPLGLRRRILQAVLIGLVFFFLLLLGANLALGDMILIALGLAAIAAAIPLAPAVIPKLAMVNPQAIRLMAAPGRLATHQADAREWSKTDSVLLLESEPFGGRVLTIHRDDDARMSFRYLGISRTRCRRLLQLWLIPGDPAPPIFESDAAPTPTPNSHSKQTPSL